MVDCIHQTDFMCRPVASGGAGGARAPHQRFEPPTKDCAPCDFLQVEFKAVGISERIKGQPVNIHCVHEKTVPLDNVR